MESLDLQVCCIDDLLDFNINDDECGKPTKRPRNALSSVNRNGCDFDVFEAGDDTDRLFPECAEEELEWLSNFPTVETFVDISSNPNILKQQSPNSVLENSNSSSSTSTNGSTITNGNNNSNSIIMNCCGNLRVPVRARSKLRTRCRRELLNQEAWWGSVHGSVKAAKPVVSKVIIGRKCQHCGAEKTPQWRAGPMGPKTLCNACGVRFKSGRLVPEYRPANSPTFSSELHSNSHRKVVEMRRQKQMMGIELGVLGVKPVDKG
ncbi:GATA transcription factor 1 [Citrus sinensis]|uniref:GATA-type domain-containing protein n=1 Tax=Citrus sinensis TaxID=2711 RepID=A0A067E4Y6_CITSI|nr:GATA transcription factor 1 isoform X1 [Citrus sinensis]KAH9650297.1 GATA transcription factor 1 [Citrus sinensis]KDO46287.1 hypothetical protein CISIN_1g024771mg [Citrus sinensis]